MQSIAGIFADRATANQAINDLLQAKVPVESIVFLSGDCPNLNTEMLPTTDAESDGMGEALGAYVGGVTAASAGLGLGSGIAALMVPGVGPILAAGIGAATLLGLGGATIGGAIGAASEHKLDTGVPRDQVEFYRDLLRQRRTIVIVDAETSEQAERSRNILDACGGTDPAIVRREWRPAA
jgi:hypothetical protein